MKEDEYPRRKHPRLKEYDYSQEGCYFITICTAGKHHTLGHVVGRGLAPADVILSETGLIVKEELLALGQKYPNLQIDKYCIMPNHIHVIFQIIAAGASPRPTGSIMDMVRTFKSVTTRRNNERKVTPGRKLWQVSFYDRVIRDQEEYDRIWEYIDVNPAIWAQDEYYT